MVALVETSGTKAKVTAYDTTNDAKEELLTRYFNAVKTAHRIDWRCSWIDLEEEYAKVDSWAEITEWRIAEIQ